MRRFLRLSFPEQRLLIKALFVTGAVRAGLDLLPFTTLRRTVSRMTARRATQRGDGMTLEQIVRIVEVASRFVPRATCLTQALSAQIFLGRRGFRSQLRIGVARDRDGVFIAHAWIEHEGEIVLGKLQGEEFTELPIPGESGF